ncbi:MAG: CHAT domain-containing protein, partial [Cyanobacteria bacterium J06631_2]
VQDISRRLAQLAEQTGQKPAFINISLQSNQLESFIVLPEQTQANAENSLLASSELENLESSNSEALALRKTVKDTSRKDVIAAATEFREEISNIRKLNQSEYKKSAQELYNVLIRPIEAELEANDIDVLVFSMDSGLRLLPVAALHDGEQFLIEKYAMGIVPSFGLTDTRYVSPAEGSILAMGASEFEEQAALPTMPIELQTIVGNPRRGESFLNEQFTIPNFVAQNSREAPFSIIHLGTHAEFKAGDLNDSYIQFYDDKLKIPQLQQLSEDLGWNSDATPIELLVLSACETALGDKEAELGFAGLAVQAGVKSALASLWYVSDLGTLALMGEFYDQLGNTLVKAEALRQTQLEMLRGNVMVDDRQVKLSNGAGLDLAEDFPAGSLSLDHPYFWSSFTLIGNWN